MAHMDGGWWPQTRNLPAELPSLLTSLERVIGHVALVGYHLNAWDKAPDHLDVGADRVLLQGFTADEPHSVVVIAKSGQRLTLLVISAESTELLAEQALSRSSAPSANPGITREAEKATDRAMADVATRLSRHEGITDETEKATIAEWVNDATQQFDHAPIQGYVPILVEHIVRSRLASATRGD